MFNKTLVCLILALASLLISFPSYSQIIEKNGYSIEITKQPDWSDRLKPVTKRKIKKRNIKSGLRYELVNKLEKNMDGNREYYQQLISTPVRQNGLSEVSDISIDFNPEYQKLKLHYIKIIRDGLEIDKLDVNEINLIRREEELESSIYNGIVTLSTQLKGIQLNDMVDYAFTISGTNPIYQNKIFGQLYFGWSIPVEKIRVGVYLPSKKLKIKVHESDLKPSVKKTEHGYFYEIIDNRADFIESEGSTPTWFNPYPWLQYSEFKSWAKVNNWAQKLFTVSSKFDENLQTRVDTIKNSKKSDEDKIIEAIKLVQEDVRYFGIEIGVNSHKPHDPQTVFDRKYGDCKDKTVLLNTILSELGIKAVPALVNTDQRKYLDSFLAVPNAFDHVISKIYFNDKVYWVDGTQSFQAGGLSEYDNRWFERALSVEKGSRSLETVDYLEKSTAIDVLEKFASNKEGEVHLTVKTTFRYGNADSFRRRIANNSFEAIADSYYDFYSRLFDNVEYIEETEYIDNEAKNEITVIEKYLIDGFFEENDDGSTTYNVYASQVGNYTELPSKLKRETPLGLSFPIEVKHNVEVSFFEGGDFAIPDTVFLETDALNFESSAKKIQNGVSYQFKYKTLKDYVSVDNMPLHIKSLKRINDVIDENYYYEVADTEDTKEEASFLNIMLESLLED